MRLILPLLLLGALAGAAHAQCTQADAVSKMQSILASPRYREAVSQTGTHEAPDASRTVTKDALRTFGGALGGLGAGVMQEQDNAQARNDINASVSVSVSRTKSITITIADAGAALGRDDYATACILYDVVKADLGIQ